MRFVLDTGVFFRPAILRGLGSAQCIVPAVVYMERIRHLRRDGRKASELDDALVMLGATVEPFTRAHALRIGRVDDARWRRLARDAMVAAHVGDDDVLLTTNSKDFRELGLTTKQVLAIG